MKWIQKIFATLGELQGAMRDHRQWIQSPRAQALEESTEVLVRVLTAAAALAWLWVAYIVWSGAEKALQGRVIEVPADALEARSALFYAFMGAFAIPAAVFAAGFVVVWTYRIGRAVSYRYLPRFVHGLYFPVVLIAAAVVAAEIQPAISATAAQVWLQGETVLASATRHRVGYSAAPERAPEPVKITLEDLIRAKQKLKEAQPQEP